jgi:transposase
LEIELNKRNGISDDEWMLIGPLLPFERGRVGRGGRPAADNRAYFEGMMWMARSGAQWRLLPVEFGKWNSVFRRYRRWVKIGVFDTLLKTLAEAVQRDSSVGSIDSATNTAYYCAVELQNGKMKTRLLLASPLPCH